MLSEAHAALAEIDVREYQWQEAERSFRRALQLNPNNAPAHMQLGAYLLVPLGRFDEGIRENSACSGLGSGTLDHECLPR
jgi:Flp pilus assembly protein TadD